MCYDTHYAPYGVSEKMRQRRAYRWFFFLAAFICFVYFVFIDSDSLWALGAFFLTGGLWYWLERRKMLELDARRRIRPRSDADNPSS